MYGGDEIGAIVIDVGTNSVKSGYGGEDLPKSIFPTDFGKIVQDSGTKYYFGSNNLWSPRENLEISNPLEKGLINDWNAFENLLNYTLQDTLHLESKEHPILFVEPSFNTKQIREKLTELLFEKYEVPALFLSKSAVLSCFSSGKSSGLVVDLGAGSTTVSPVHDGYVLNKCIMKSSVGGNFLTEELNDIFKKKKYEIIPHYLLKNKKLISNVKVTPSFHKYRVNCIVNDIKEVLCRVADLGYEDLMAKNSNIPSIPYELPDGNVVEVGVERFKVPELLFSPDLLESRKTEDMIGLSQMVFTSISKCDQDIRRELFSSVIATGGSSLFPQLTERLRKELDDKSPQMYKVKIAGNSPTERKFASWIGGSILSSLGTFHQMWMSSQEYEEHGRSMVERKCP